MTIKRFYHTLLACLLSCLFLLLPTSCGTVSTVPLSGRSQRLLVSDAQILSLSQQQYRAFLAKAPRSHNATQTAMVRRVGQRLAAAVEQYLRTHNAAQEIKNFHWEFNLIQSQQANAFCMPGGKIVVYTGILPYTQTENALAIVLGHEIAHAVAKHSAEQMSQHIRANIGAQAFNIFLGQSKTRPETKALASLAFGFGSNSLMRKFSRSHESEADYMGLIFAAMAGYNPQAAIPFWQRMSAAGGRSLPAFFSDHPSNARRIRQLRKHMPEAMTLYENTRHHNRALPPYLFNSRKR